MQRVLTLISSKKLKQAIPFILIVGSFLLLRISGLGTDISNSDALRWHRRSMDFETALKSGNFADTYQRYHPGVTLMYIGATAKEIFEFVKPEVSHLIPQNYPFYHGIAKTLHALILGGSLVLALWYINKLYGKTTAVWFGMFAAFEIYFVAINRWFHLTSMEVLFSFISYLVVLDYLKFKRNSSLIISAVMMGLAVLTKTSALMILPVIFIKLVKNPKALAAFLLVATLTFVLLFPAMWTTPIAVLSRMSDAIFNAVSESERLPYASSWARVGFYLLILVAKLTPLFVVLLAYTATKIKDNSHLKEYIFDFLTPFLLILLILSASSQKIDRYVISLYPYLFVVVSRGLTGLKTKTAIMLGSAYVAQALVFYFLSFPVLSGYVSPLIGGPRILHHTGLLDNSGEYFAQAAVSLNEKCPSCTVLTPNNNESFSPYFLGRTTREYTDTISYEVASIDTSRPKFAPVQCDEVVASFGYNGFSTVKIYSCK